jgi:addiction module RelE/StbE family toxin
MKVNYSRYFLKQYSKLPLDIKEKFRERLRIFCYNKNHPYLKTHGLQGRWAGYFSFNVTGDYRVIFEYENIDDILLATIGTHSQLYD